MTELETIYECCASCELHFKTAFELYEHDGKMFCMECLRSQLGF